jgi:hypothetical protein
MASSKVAIASAARLKITRLKLGISEFSRPNSSFGARSSTGPLDGGGSTPVFRRPSTSRTSSGQFDSMRLSMRLLTLSRKATGQRLVTYYDSQVVLLEWKSGFGFDPTLIEGRVNQVAAFLHPIEPSFHGLPCRGYVKDHSANRYGYIFDLAASFQSSPTNTIVARLPQCMTLKQLLSSKSGVPSLNQRLTIAVNLSKTLLNLHTAGWLHNELTSENILFFRSPVADEDVEDHLDISQYSTFIAGYVYARAGEPGAMTEPLQSDIEADLHRHPSTSAFPRPPYQKKFDIFSVGCALLEIGLWKSLREVFDDGQNPKLPFNEKQDIKSPPRASVFASISTELNLVDSHGSDGDETKGSLISSNLILRRHDLLLSRLKPKRPIGQTKSLHGVDGDFRVRDHCKILQSLEAAVGNKYTTLVEQMLAVEVVSLIRKRMADEIDDEDEFALDLEIQARDTLQSILNAI